MKKIKSLKRYDCTDKGQNRLVYEVQYNEQEKPVVEIEYSHGGIPVSTNKYEYDDQGNLIRETVQGEEKEAFQQLDYQYSDDKKKMVKTLTYADGSTEKEETKLEDNKKTIQKFNLDGELEEETVEIFNEAGKIEILEYYNANMESREKHLYAYDEKNQMTEELVSVDGEDIQKTVWEYDDNGHKVLEQSFDPEGQLIHKHYYQYKGDLLMEEGIEEYRSYNNQLRFQFEYDDDGRLIRQVQETYNGELIQEVGYELNERGDIEMAHFVRTGLYQMLYGSSTAEYNQSLRNEIEYYE